MKAQPNLRTFRDGVSWTGAFSTGRGFRVRNDFLLSADFFVALEENGAKMISYFIRAAARAGKIRHPAFEAGFFHFGVVTSQP